MAKLLTTTFVSIVSVAILALATLLVIGLGSERTAQIASLEDAQKIFVALGGPEDGRPIVLFTAQWCASCKALAQDMRNHNISFITTDIEKDPEAEHFYELILGESGETVPLTMVGTQSFLGYQKEEILQAIAVLPY